MRKAAYLMGTALVVTTIASGAMVTSCSAADNSDSAGQKGITVASSQPPAPSGDPEFDGDYDLSVEDAFIDDGEPETYEEFARDAAAGQNPDALPPVAGGGAITVTDGGLPR